MSDAHPWDFGFDDLDDPGDSDKTPTTNVAELVEPDHSLGARIRYVTGVHPNEFGPAKFKATDGPGWQARWLDEVASLYGLRRRRGVECLA